MPTVRCSRCSLEMEVSETPAGEFRCPACLAQETITLAAVADPGATVAPSVGRSVTQGGRAPDGYEVLGELGRGGMGVVYKAHQAALDRVVALKMILSGAHAGEDDVRRLRREAEAIARLQHPGIVQVFEIGEHEGRPFLALEFCAGGSLEKKLGGVPMPPREAAALVRKLADAVQAAHEAKVVHRDLKPGNVLLAGDGTPKVTDFGLAKKLDTQGATVSGAIMGTPSYMAPEQASGAKDVGPAADTYALGAILYECLVGRPPFRAASAYETIVQVIADEPVPPRQLNAGVPRDLETIALKCLRKDPGKRYATARELSDDLGRFLVGEPVAARPVGAVERGAKWVRRNPALAAMAALILVTLTAATVISTLFAVRADEQAKEALRQSKKAEDSARQANKNAEGERKQKERADELASKATEEASAAKKARDEAKAETKRANEEKHRANVILHSFRIKEALQEWERHEVWRAEAILSQVSAEFRQTFEYRHVRELCRRKMVTLDGHEGRVTAVAYSPDGSRIASGSKGRLKVWDARTGKVLFALALGGHQQDVVTAVAYSPDGSRIISGISNHGADSGEVKVWDARGGRVLLTLKGHRGPVVGVAYSPDGCYIVSGSHDKTLKVWDARTGKRMLTLEGHTSDVKSVAYSPDGSRIASASADWTIKVWDARTGQDLLTLKGHTEAVRAVAYSPDGKCVVSGSDDKSLRVWDAWTGKELLTLEGHVGRVNSVAYSPDGSRLASGSEDKSLRMWDAWTGKPLLTLQGHTDAGQSPLELPHHPASVYAVAFSPDGYCVVSASDDGTLKVWDAQVRQDLLSLKGRAGWVHAVAYSPDGSRLVSGAGDVKVWDTETGRVLLSLEGQARSVYAVAYSPDGSRIASGSDDETIKVWDARTGQALLTLKGHTEAVRAVAYSPDGKCIVSGSLDRTLKVWDARTGQDLLTLEGHRSGVFALAYSPDGFRIVSGSGDETLKVWDARTGRDLLSLQGHVGWVNAVAYSPDSCCIVSGGEDSTLKVWDAKTGQDLLTLKGHVKGVRAVAFSPDGSRIVSGSEDKTLKLWDAQSGQDLLTLEGHTSSVNAVSYRPDGSRIVSASVDETPKFWDAPTLEKETHTLEATLRARHAREFHEAESERTRRTDPFACVFHLDRLLALSPDERPALLKRRAAVLSPAIELVSNYRPARVLARQAVANPDSVPEATWLLPALARHPHAPLDRLYGAVLLRSGNARDAVTVLRAAIRNRTQEQPPIDELLLALALLKLDRRDEARQHLKTAADWMDRGTAPQRLASILGARPAGPLAALASVAHVPDVRLNPLDPFTAHELATLRAEAERALGDRK